MAPLAPMTGIILAGAFVVAFSLFFPKPVPIISIVLVSLMILGFLRYQLYLPKIDAGHIGFYNGQELVVDGIVDAEPSNDDTKLKVQISKIKIRTEKEFLSLKGDILAELPRNVDVKYGDQIRFKAKLKKPTDSIDFSYSNYLAKAGIYSIAQNVEKFEIIASGKGSLIVSALYQTKAAFVEKIKKIFPEPHAGMIQGLILGGKGTLPDYLVALFQIVGITHIVAISGYNISILAKISEGLIGRWHRKLSLWGTLFLIAGLVIITGAQASVVRAGIMGAVLVLAGFVDRKNNPLNALVLVGTIMIFFNPLILRDDVGFQLSFLATLGIVLFFPIFSHIFRKVPEPFSEALSATLAAQTLALPILITNFGALSLISPLANMIILPLIPVAMTLGFFSGVLAFINLYLGQMLAFFGYAVLDLIIKISEFLARIPYAYLEIKSGKLAVWLIWCVILLVLLVAKRKETLWKKK